MWRSYASLLSICATYYLAELSDQVEEVSLLAEGTGPARAAQNSASNLQQPATAIPLQPLPEQPRHHETSHAQRAQK